MFRIFNEDIKNVKGMNKKSALEYLKSIGIEPFEIEEDYITIGNEWDYVMIEMNDKGIIDEVYEVCEE